MQINRLFEIIYILLENGTVTAREFSEHFEVSVRTVYRDVEVLSQSGIPIYMSKGKGGGISLMPDFILNKTVLTEKEKSEILSSIKAVNAVSLSESNSVLSKLSSMFGNHEPNWIEVDFSSWGIFEDDTECFNKLKKAVIEKRLITFLYSSGKGEKIFRTVMPLKLIFKGSSWYLYGFCKIRSDYRFFKLRRITELSVTEEIFEMTVSENIIENRKVDMSAGIKVKLKISSKMAFKVYDEIRNYIIDENGDFICELYFPDIDSICTYVLSFGEHCTILSPQRAVDDIKIQLEKILKNYF